MGTSYTSYMIYFADNFVGKVGIFATSADFDVGMYGISVTKSPVYKKNGHPPRREMDMPNIKFVAACK